MSLTKTAESVCPICNDLFIDAIILPCCLDLVCEYHVFVIDKIYFCPRCENKGIQPVSGFLKSIDNNDSRLKLESIKILNEKINCINQFDNKNYINEYFDKLKLQIDDKIKSLQEQINLQYSNMIEKINSLKQKCFDEAPVSKHELNLSIKNEFNSFNYSIETFDQELDYSSLINFKNFEIDYLNSKIDEIFQFYKNSALLNKKYEYSNSSLNIHIGDILEIDQNIKNSLNGDIPEISEILKIPGILEIPNEITNISLSQSSTINSTLENIILHESANGNENKLLLLKEEEEEEEEEEEQTIVELVRIHAHLNPINHVLYDKTGNYIITGSEDRSIKIWRASDAILLCTLKGHNEIVYNLDINFENTLLASVSDETQILTWNLQTGELNQILKNDFHTSAIKFSPLFKNETRKTLVSGCTNGTISMWYFDPISLQFESKPNKYVINNVESNDVFLSFSSGGSLLAVTFDKGNIYLFCLLNNNLQMIGQIEYKIKSIHTIKFSNNSEKFLVGSKLGEVILFEYASRKLLSNEINAKEKRENKKKKFIYKKNEGYDSITNWSIDDSMIISGMNLSFYEEYLIKVWKKNLETNKYTLSFSFNNHKSTIYSIEPDPFNQNFLLSCSADGNLIFWDLSLGKELKSFSNKSQSKKNTSIYAVKWSSNKTFSSVDSKGFLNIYGPAKLKKYYENTPKSQFLKSDFSKFDQKIYSFKASDSTSFFYDENKNLINCANIKINDKYIVKPMDLNILEKSQSQRLKHLEREEEILRKEKKNLNRHMITYTRSPSVKRKREPLDKF